MAKIFVLADYYLPGFRAGGPVRSISNLVERLGTRFEFWILTRDRDVEDAMAYAGVRANAWNQVGRSMVYYASPDALSASTTAKLVREVRPDLIYLNSFFSGLTIRFLMLRRLRRVPDAPVVLVPRGEFSPGALRLGAAKKRLYIALAKRAGLYHKLVWQVSSDLERKDIQAAMGANLNTYVAPNLPPVVKLGDNNLNQRPEKMRGAVRLVFLSRISPKKNLRYAFESLAGLSGRVTLDVYGPLEDRDYWRQCESAVARMPANVQLTVRGPLPNEQVVETLSRYHFFLLPTLGENFGHVVLEALSAGCPVIISDRTPWRGLESKGVGWDLPLEDQEVWREVLQRCVAMDAQVYQRLSQAARQFAAVWTSSPELESATMTLFAKALGAGKCVA